MLTLLLQPLSAIDSAEWFGLLNGGILCVFAALVLSQSGCGSVMLTVVHELVSGFSASIFSFLSFFSLKLWLHSPSAVPALHL